MMRIENAVRVMAGVMALLVMAPPSAAAQEKKQAAPALVKKQATPAQGVEATLSPTRSRTA